LPNKIYAQYNKATKEETSSVYLCKEGYIKRTVTAERKKMNIEE
jgi:hypothetical protein